MAAPLKELAGLFDEVTTSFWEGTVFEHPPSVTLAEAPRRVAPCWFSRYMGDVAHDCDGSIQGCHFIKRQQVEKMVGAQLPNYGEAIAAGDIEPGNAVDFIEWQMMLDEAVMLAAWDARNGIPGCEHHHQLFDGGRLLVPRKLVQRAALHVVEFSNYWGLETALLERTTE